METKGGKMNGLIFTNKKDAVVSYLQYKEASISDISIALLLHPQSVRTAVGQLVAEGKIYKLDDGWKTQYTAKAKGRIIRLTDTRHNEGGTIGMRADPLHRRTIGQAF